MASNLDQNTGTPNWNPCMAQCNKEGTLLSNSGKMNTESSVLPKIREEDFDESFDEDEDDGFSDIEGDFKNEIKESLDNDVIGSLLKFAENVNCDIQKYFGRRKNDSDSCDIYEDKWTSGKSGRELYYAELLRIAHGENSENKSAKASSSRTLNKTIKDEYTGKVNKEAGLGPLNELFEVSMNDKGKTVKDVTQRVNKKGKSAKSDTKSNDFIPMNKRKLPKSFWDEPSGANKKVNGDPSAESSGPDFSDLLLNWSGEGTHNLTPSDSNSPSEESESGKGESR